ncbi:MAG TPA: hypothetical protein VG389_29620 [Myxococcota bacterium]|nr:hypothetical protein [Myxococcota bacterium]
MTAAELLAALAADPAREADATALATLAREQPNDVRAALDADADRARNVVNGALRARSAAGTDLVVALVETGSPAPLDAVARPTRFAALFAHEGLMERLIPAIERLGLGDRLRAVVAPMVDGTFATMLETVSHDMRGGASVDAHARLLSAQLRLLPKSLLPVAAEAVRAAAARPVADRPWAAEDQQALADQVLQALESGGVK